MTRRKATQKWQQKLATKDTVEYEELNAEVYENIYASPHWKDSIGWHKAWSERKMKSGTARAWLRRLLWRYGMNLEGATRKNLYREAYRLYEEAREETRTAIWQKALLILGDIPRGPYRWEVDEGRVTEEEYFEGHNAQQQWYQKMYALRNLLGYTGGYVEFPTEYEIVFVKKQKETTIDDI